MKSLTSAPDCDTGCILLFSFVHSPDQGGQHMEIFRVIIVPRAIAIGGYGRYEVGAVLAIVCVAKADTGNLLQWRGSLVGSRGMVKRASSFMDWGASLE